MPSLKTSFYSIVGLAIFAGMLMMFAEPYRISGDCMEPAIQDGKSYFLDKASHYFSPYQIGDVILFEHEGKVWVSRILALENNSIKIIQDSLIINGVTLQDSIKRNWSSWQHGTFGVNNTFQVPANHIYVLSDNLSAHHDDSRVFGAISHSAIIGRLREFP